MTAVSIRRAEAADFPAIDALTEAAYAHDYGPATGDHDDPMHRAEVRAERFDLWVAETETGEIVGSVTTRRAGGSSLHEDVTPDELDLRLLGVAPGLRRAGVGAALMRFVIAEAGRAGFRKVFLKTAPNMHGAHRLYEALGFARVPERDGLWIGGEKVLDLLSYRIDAGLPGSSQTGRI